jgi:cytoskeletal protein CcmA (bactofilin family)
MFDKKNDSSTSSTTDVFRPVKGSARVVIGHGVSINGVIKKADEVQIDGEADVTMKTDNLVVGATGDCKGNIETHNADIWGSIDGDIKASGTLTIQEEGKVSGKIEYQNLQIKLGGKITGDLKISDKVQSIKKETKNKDEDGRSSETETKDSGSRKSMVESPVLPLLRKKGKKNKHAK